MDLFIGHFLILFNNIRLNNLLIPMLNNQKHEQHTIILCKLAEIAEAGGLTLVLDEVYSRFSSGVGMGKVIVEI
ncbi:hypothetical protein [Psychromonas algicola]|uniref:hypothetical protein n=1 Tax=Psychromonas algicola TaxID=2555642 RepID=UPI00106829C8|nr:hypothetical protein [Psychromonas sp. RZ5]TEW51254.1 hypothetical protein E2R67_08535 [Psychromonas sp. RZ5]